MVIPLGWLSPATSRDLPGPHQRGKRLPCFISAARGPYLVLLPAGFALPPALPQARCALTAPFHPYLFIEEASIVRPRYRSPSKGVVAALLRVSTRDTVRRYIFCGTFPEITPGGSYPPPFSVEPGLSSRLRAARSGAQGEDGQPSGHLARQTLAYRRPTGKRRV